MVRIGIYISEVKNMKIDEREKLLTGQLKDVCAQSHILEENLKQLKEQETVIRNRLNELQTLKQEMKKEEVKKDESKSEQDDKSK